MSICFVHWHGAVGGAEVLAAELIRSLRDQGVEAELVFIGEADPLAARLDATGLPYRSLGFARGRDVLREPRRLARALSAAGAEGAVLPECGYLGAVLRAGGYRAPLLAVEHGALLLDRGRSTTMRLARRAARAAGARAHDAEIAVSDFMLELMHSVPHARRLTRIHNGIDTARMSALAEPPEGEALVAGFAGRLIEGKGVDDAMAAVARARATVPVRLLVAGDGPMRTALQERARALGVEDAVEFLGMVSDVRELWARCHVAMVPSHQFIESFGMAALEAMACGRPVLGTRNGAIPEVVADGSAGTLVAPGDIGALAAALVAYAGDPALRHAHGAGARERAVEEFELARCARAYLSCVAAARPGAGAGRSRSR